MPSSSSSTTTAPSTPSSKGGFWSHLSPSKNHNSKKESKKQQQAKLISSKNTTTNSSSTPSKKLDYSTPNKQSTMEEEEESSSIIETSFESNDNIRTMQDSSSLDMLSPIPKARNTTTPNNKVLALDTTMMTTSTTGTGSFTIEEEEEEEEDDDDLLLTTTNTTTDDSFIMSSSLQEDTKTNNNNKRMVAVNDDNATTTQQQLQQIRSLLQSCDCRDFEKVYTNIQQLVPNVKEESIADLRRNAQKEMAIRNLVQYTGCRMEDVSKLVPTNNDANVEVWFQNPPFVHQRLQSILSTALWSIYDFFHARTEDVRLVGYMRMAYAILFLYSRGLFAYDLTFLLHPQTGVLPYRSTQYTIDDDDYSLFALFPNSVELVYGLYALGLLNGILLLLGIAPRFQAMGIFFFYYQFGHHNSILSDNQDVMMRMYALMLALAPLDHITIYDGFGRKTKTKTSTSTTTSSTSWPMWPFRCWQILVCLVYMGAGYGKLSSDVWRSGMALYYPPYEEGFGRFWNPDFIFNRMGPIQLLTWSTLVLECTCMFTIWPTMTRKWTLMSVIGLHVGIELTMIMHIFQYISVLGWCTFLVKPTTTSRQALQPPRKRSFFGGKGGSSSSSKNNKILQTGIALFLLYAFTMNTLPTSRILSILSSSSPTTKKGVRRWFRRNVHNPVQKARSQLYPFLKMTGLHMGEWTLFSGIPTHENHRYTAVIRFHNDDDLVLWQSPDWTASSWMERELMLWKDSYYYYIWVDNNDAETSFPILTTFMEHLARTYSTQGAIEYEPAPLVDDNNMQGERLKIHPNNTIRSISLVMHQEIGQSPPSKRSYYINWYDWWTKPIRLPTMKHSECLGYWKFPKRRNKIQYKYLSYEYDADDDLDAQTGCWKYNTTDTIHHMVGSYDDDTITNEEEDTEYVVVDEYIVAGDNDEGGAHHDDEL